MKVGIAKFYSCEVYYTAVCKCKYCMIVLAIPQMHTNHWSSYLHMYYIHSYSQLLWVHILFLPITFYCRYIHINHKENCIRLITACYYTVSSSLMQWISPTNITNVSRQNCKSWQDQLLGELLSRPQPNYSICCWQQKM